MHERNQNAVNVPVSRNNNLANMGTYISEHETPLIDFIKIELMSSPSYFAGICRFTFAKFLYILYPS